MGIPLIYTFVPANTGPSCNTDGFHVCLLIEYVSDIAPKFPFSVSLVAEVEVVGLIVDVRRRF